MSIIKEYFYNIECDVCGECADVTCWHTDPDTAKLYLDENGFKELGGKHYCGDCWHYDDDDNIVTKDGRKFNGDTEEEILCKEMEE